MEDVKVIEEKLVTEVIDKKIIGNEGKNIYMLNWYYVANFGTELIRADSEEGALKKFCYTGNREVSIIITKIELLNMPVIRKGTGNPEGVY